MRHSTSKQTTAGPVRTCCGCGQRDQQQGLVRMTLVDGTLTLDQGRRGQGRGAYLHRHGSCWGAFARGKGYVRSLRRRLSQEERAVPASTIEQCGERARDAGLDGVVPVAPEAG